MYDTSKIANVTTGVNDINATPSTARCAISADTYRIPNATYARSLRRGRTGRIRMSPPINVPILTSRLNHSGNHRCCTHSIAIGVLKKNIPGRINSASKIVDTRYRIFVVFMISYNR